MKAGGVKVKLVKKITVFVLAFILFITTHGGVFTYMVAQAAAPKTTVLQNDYIKITVNNATGRFGIRTIDGQPVRKGDDNVNMLFQGDDPETSFTTFRIDGTDYIFGNPYKFAADFFSEITAPVIVDNANGTRQIETVWSIGGVAVKQILMLYSNAADVRNAGNVNVRYEVYNRSGATVEIGTRILLDTMVAGKDGPEFQIGTAYNAPLTVERKLVHDPAAIGIPAADTAYYKLPPYWVMRDNLDLSNPLATNVIAYGFNNFSENDINIVDEMIVGHWNGLANTKWDYEVNPNLDFTRDTNDYGTADSAVALYWLPDTLPANGFTTFETVYGLGEIIAPDKVFSIRYLDPVMQLSTLPDNSGYADEGIFSIIAEIENLPSFNMEHSNITVDLTLESGLNFVQVDEQGNVIRDGNGLALTESVRSKQLILRKPATIEEAEQGIIPKYQPGDAVTVSFLVQAKGRPWPTTRQYLLTARSPETLMKLEGVQNAEADVMAQYEANKANFILLPPVGEASATYVYGLSPQEAYVTDDKYITLNLSNVEAYQTGDMYSDPNFDLYLTETVTGERYKVPVANSVLIQPTDDGSTGDMIITYRGGDRVNSNGIIIEAGLGPELPIGQYQVEIDYKGDAGGDEETAALYDITTAQTFLVTDNDQARIRNANLLVIYKQIVDLSFVSATAAEADLQAINEIMYHKPFAPGADLYGAKLALRPALAGITMSSRMVDPDLGMDSLLDEGFFDEYPLYNYRTFSSMEEMEAFFSDPEDPQKQREDLELLVTIEGMVKEIGRQENLQAIVDTSTEPAIINGAVHYQGKDMVLVRGSLEVFGSKYDHIPLVDTLFARGDGTLSVAGSGFVFHKGEWTLDFFNGFHKSLSGAVDDDDEGEDEDQDEEDDNDNPEDDSLNGSLAWAQGALGSRLNPMRQVMLEDVYFNRHSLFSLLPLSVGGFNFSFNEFILRQGGVSFGGKLSFKVVDAEIKNVVFNNKGFVGVDASLKFQLDKDIGLIKADSNTEGVSGEINITHYEQQVEGISNTYGLKFAAELSNMVEVDVEFALKQVADGRILPDDIAFGTTLGQPGVLITGATYLTAVRGAIRDLADTIAGGTKADPFPLTLEAGVSIRFGIAPAYHFGDIDMTLKRTGIAIVGKLDFSTDPGGGSLMPMISEALLEAQWVTPWFVRLQAEVDIMGWDVIIGKAGIFVGQNLEKNRIDFEGFIGAKVQIPGEVPIVGGMPLASVFLGLNNDKIWGSVGILFISLGITYYWGGGVEFGTSGEGLPEGLIHMIVEDPEKGSQLVVIGQGIETVATSWLTPEQENQEIVYRDLGNGTVMVEQGTMSIGIGGILSRNGGRIHDIPMAQANGNALLEISCDGPELPNLTLRDGTGKPYPIIIDNTNSNPEATAFTQWIPAAAASDGVDSYKAYIVVSEEKLQAGGDIWTLSAESPVDTKLLAVPATPELTSIRLNADDSDPNRFTASWNVRNAKAGDTISLYLTTDAVSEEASSEALMEPGDPGLLIAKDLPAGVDGNGSYDIDATAVSLLGDVEDIRGLLQQGEYYLRAELKSYAAFETKTSIEKFEIINPLAPLKVTQVQVEPAGNGMFALSFKPAAKKPGHEGYEHSYVIHAEIMEEGAVTPYANLGELLFTEAELAPYWNAASGAYEGLLVGGWTEVSTGVSSEDAASKYVGLQPGEIYSIGVTSATKPPKNIDKNENYHLAEASASLPVLLPIPAEPGLANAEDGQFAPMIQVLTNQTAQTVSLLSDQQNIEVEALYNGQSLGTVKLANNGNGSSGSLSFDSFTADGTYAIELLARNTVTKDQRITLLYLTVDTIAPVLYITQPATGERTRDGYIHVAGQTSNDANLIVGGVAIAIDRQGDGTFNQDIPIRSDEPVMPLLFVARDDAGNENRAVISVTNDSFAVPVGLELRAMKLAPGQQQQLQAALRYADGKTEAGKVRFKTEAIHGEQLKKLSYTLMSGDSVVLSSDGTVLGVSNGASLVRVSYQVAENVTLEALLPVQVEEIKPTELQAINVYTAIVSGESNKTKVVVTNAGEHTGYQLVYKLFSGNEQASKPAFGDNLDSWSILPVDGVITVQQGNRIVVAKRTSLDKEAVASSSVLTVATWANQPAAGGMPGSIGPIGPIGPGAAAPGPMELTVNGLPISAEWINDTRVAAIKEQDVAGTEGNVVISSGDAEVKRYSISAEAAAVRLMSASGQSVVIDLPSARLVLKPEQLGKLAGEDLRISIAPNSSEDILAANAIANSVGASLLGQGSGISISTNIPAADWQLSTKALISIPDNVNLRQLHAIILLDENGFWTPVPWTLEMNGGKASAKVVVTGAGSFFFTGSEVSFSDVPATFWGKQAIDEAASKLLVLGKGSQIFEPDSQVTRAEFPTMLLRASGLMNQAAPASGFSDVDPAAWYNRSVAVASSLGIVNGMEDGSYVPHAQLSRIEGMVMIGRMLELYGVGVDMTASEVDDVLERYVDAADIPVWGRAAAALAIQSGIITGTGNGEIQPAAPLNRTQAAIIAVRVEQWMASLQ